MKKAKHMTTNQATIRNITQPIKLLDWILDQAVQRAVTEHEFLIIDEFLLALMSEIFAYGFLPAQAVSGIDMDDFMSALSESINLNTSVDRLKEFVHDTLKGTFLDKEPELHQVVEQLARAARIRSAITFRRIGHDVRIRSSRALIETHSVLIDVVVPLRLRVRSVLRPWHSRFGWEALPAKPKPIKTARSNSGRGGSSPKT